MEANKLARLSCLFEKAVANNAKLLEKHELDELYNEFINDGRDHIKNTVVAFPKGLRRTAS
ncbi:hypothetical protein [Cognaticolwellia beringensis]|uniref:Uncharacterized protein n=1 Tax=Cognaticolwellia beringensis TaxID=1967665 RepID=A0A222G883_9GAMM|nr:hypothetical protein [Cognaticolwellia beringensis]ASP48097.1 hypothetical protein B5D82_10200 [Cognaticolwellia beringensis]